MKTKYIVMTVVIILIIVIGASVMSATSKKRSTEVVGMTYQQLCLKNGDQWMIMEPWMDGKKISDTPCGGCMIGGNHFCTVDEYTEYIRSIQVGEIMEDHSHLFSTMVAHGGYSGSAMIHMYTVKFAREDKNLIFNITETNSGKSVSNLSIGHDKIMHVILVRNDLTHFDHIHPDQIEPGIFSVPYNFTAPGTYRIWTDFIVDEMQHIVDFDLDVDDGSNQTDADKLAGLKVAMDTPEMIMMGENTTLKFTVTDSDGMVVPIKEKFLSASAHLIAIDETLEELGHNHDENFDGDNVISFTHMFTKIGKHKLWVQFSVDSIERTAEFVLDVK